MRLCLPLLKCAGRSPSLRRRAVPTERLQRTVPTLRNASRLWTMRGASSGRMHAAAERRSRFPRTTTLCSCEGALCLLQRAPPCGDWSPRHRQRGQRSRLRAGKLRSLLHDVQGNCVPCCTTCNMMKWTLSRSDFLDHARRLSSFARRHRGSCSPRAKQPFVTKSTTTYTAYSYWPAGREKMQRGEGVH